MDILEIAHNIFCNPVKNPCSIQLDFDSNDLEVIFKQLLVIFTEGMKIFFGDENGKVDLQSISQEDFFKINQYFHSFGFYIIYDIKNLNEDDDRALLEKKYLKDYYLRLITNNCIYYISFDFYIPLTTCKK